MGIERYLLASSLNLVVAQRLVRKICSYCKEPTTLNDELIKSLKLTEQDLKTSTFFKGKGCKNCGGTGYLGRSPIFEFLVIDREMRELIVASSTESQIRALSRQKGYGGLFDSGVIRLKQGLTTAEEVLSVTFAEDLG